MAAREVSEELLSNPLCRKLSFTGSTAAGKELLRRGADSVAHLSLELGGHATAALQVGNGLDAGVEIGPLINEKSVDTFPAHVKNAVSNGAQIDCGGERVGHGVRGRGTRCLPGDKTLVHQAVAESSPWP